MAARAGKGCSFESAYFARSAGEAGGIGDDGLVNDAGEGSGSGMASIVVESAADEFWVSETYW